jgi:hypothetical protein
MAYKFTITLEGSDPKIYRKVIVPENLSFDDFHLVIQIVMGWGNYHLYQFNLGAPFNSDCIAPIDENDDDWGYGNKFEKFDAESTLLSAVFGGGKKNVHYIYDFGDDWRHSIKLMAPPKEEVLFPVCIEGEGTCPPEDCGGLGGYYHLLECLNSKKNTEEKKDFKEWLGLSANEKFEEVFKFDRLLINEELLELFKNPS